MKSPSNNQPADNCIRLSGIVERVTFHNAENGWSVLKVSPFNEPHKLVAVVILMNGHYIFHSDGKMIDLDAIITGLDLG